MPRRERTRSFFSISAATSSARALFICYDLRGIRFIFRIRTFCLCDISFSWRNNLPEFIAVVCPSGQNHISKNAFCGDEMCQKQFLYHVFGLRSETLQALAAIVVKTAFKCSHFIQHIGNTASHAGPEVIANRPENQDSSARHVFTAMIACPFDHGYSLRIAHGKALASSPGGIKHAARSAVQACVTHYRILPGNESRLRLRANNNFAAVHTLTYIIVRRTNQGKSHSVMVKCTETLSC